MCFVNMHQYRRALKNYHILQSRDYMYLRNDRDRVNVCCVTEHCQFYMTTSAIKREETVCIRKMVLPHTCGITYDTSRVDSTWLSNRYENNFRGDPDWKISALIDTTKRNHGVDITPMMAYRARNKAADIVLGNHKQQYVRIRDYLQTVLVLVAQSNRRIFEEGPTHTEAEETPLHGEAEASPVHVQAEAASVHVHVQAEADTTTGAARGRGRGSAQVNGRGTGRGKGRGGGQAKAAIQDPFDAHAVFQAHDPFHGFDIQEVASQPAAANTREKLPVMRESGSAGGRFMEYFTASGNH